MNYLRELDRKGKLVENYTVKVRTEGMMPVRRILIFLWDNWRWV